MAWWLWLLIGLLVGGSLGFMTCAMFSVNKHDEQVDFLTESFNELADDYNTLIDNYSRVMNEENNKKEGDSDVNQ